MKQKKKKGKLTPDETAGTGFEFEHSMKAYFLLLMLLGRSPILAGGNKISALQFQAKTGHSKHHAETDDLIVFTKTNSGASSTKIFVSAKMSMGVTRKNKPFQSNIENAWKDFVGDDFDKERDFFLFICRNLSADQMRMTNNDAKTLANSRKNDIPRIRALKTAQIVDYILDKHGIKSRFSDDTLYWLKLRAFLARVRIVVFDTIVPSVDSNIYKNLLATILGGTSTKTDDVMRHLMEVVKSHDATASMIDENLIDENDELTNLRQEVKALIGRVPETSILWETEAEPVSKNEFPALSPRQRLIACVASIASSWRDENTADRNALAKMCGDTPYEEIELELKALEDQELMEYAKGKWKARDATRMWITYAQHLTSNEFRQILAEIQVILQQTALKYSPDAEGPESMVTADQYPESSSLRRGIAEGLALMATNAEACKKQIPDVEKKIDFLVYSLIETDDIALWASLETHLPDLAEASPGIVRERFYKASRNERSILAVLMHSEGNGLMMGYPFVGILWALERLMWDKGNQQKGLDVLVELAKQDRGGTYNNRPIETLKQVFQPQVKAINVVVAILEPAYNELITDAPNVAWEIGVSILDPTGFFSPPARPKWRDWADLTPPLEIGTIKLTKDEVRWLDIVLLSLCQMATSEAHETGRVDRFIDLLRRFINRISQKANQVILSALSKLDVDKISPPHIEKLLDELHRVQEKKPDVELLDELKKKFSSTIGIKKYSHIFSYEFEADIQYKLYSERNSLGKEVQESDYEQQPYEQIKSARREAVEEILNGYERAEILDFASQAGNGSAFGSILATLTDSSDTDGLVLPKYLVREGNLRVGLAQGYTAARHEELGWGWSDNFPLENWTVDETTSFWLAHPPRSETWQRLEKSSIDEQNSYWKNVGWFLPKCSADEAAHALKQYLRFKQFHTAIWFVKSECISRNLPKIPIRLLYRAFARNLDDTFLSNNFYTVIRAIEVLAEHPEVTQEKLLDIERKHIKAFHLSSRNPPTVERALTTDPREFIALIDRLYPWDDPAKSPIVQDQPKAITDKWNDAGYTFDYWKTLPGTNDEGNWSSTLFDDWYATVDQHFQDDKAHSFAMERMGVALAQVADSEGIENLPHEVLRVLNKSGSNELRRGFQLGLYMSSPSRSLWGGNWFGFVSYSLTGNAESVYAERSSASAKKVQEKYPRLAELYLENARSWRRDGDSNASLDVMP